MAEIDYSLQKLLKKLKDYKGKVRKGRYQWFSAQCLVKEGAEIPVKLVDPTPNVNYGCVYDGNSILP
ncbi:hypothetical protein DCAR_0101547 [Daucus carota subsp. sativus]|uniref:Uncharacterized protein n=1 Tax=Daucus carota subsp. sativus TaxID=79200 RepID=A0A162B1X4_DAUCS|nr:hypothetical protein DCAR_0101547 [Daucus carota subsp. sativus]